MRTALATIALLGSALAAPVADRNFRGRDSNNNNATPTNKGGDGEGVAPTEPFPTPDGFPTPNPQQLIQIERNAHGTLSNQTGAPLSDDTTISLQVIGTNEEMESDFFENFLFNVTNNVPGFDRSQFNSDDDRNFLIDTLKQIVGIEELHAINANKGLMGNKKQPISPSKYAFPVTKVSEALDVANQFTDVVLGTLQDVIRRAADAGDDGFTNGIASVIGDEGEQNGFFRTQQHRTPAAQPFLTAGDRRIAFSLLERLFIIPGTDHNDIDLPVFLAVSVDTKNIEPKDQTLQFTLPFIQGAGNQATNTRRHVRRQANETAVDNSETPSSTTTPVTLSTGTTKPFQSIPDGALSGSKGGKTNDGSKASYDPSKYGKDYDYSNTFVTFVSEQNAPVTVPIKNQKLDGSTLHFEADFLAETFFFDADTIVVVTNTAGPFSNVTDVTDHAIAVGLIEATD